MRAVVSTPPKTDGEWGSPPKNTRATAESRICHYVYSRNLDVWSSDACLPIATKR